MREWTRAVDCHATANAKSRNDKQKMDSSVKAVDCHADKSARNDENNTAKQKVDSSKGGGNA